MVDEDYTTDKKRQKKTLQTLIDKVETYRSWLLQLTICDPACGSGAFLNQALDFLIAEHQYIDELKAKLFGDTFVLSDVETSILENNLFGVDLNEESVEIAKLSLWLRTAQPNRKLNDLSGNIQCGNSLIDDVSLAGNKAFNWQQSFEKVFAKGGFDVVIGNPPWGAKLDILSTEYLLEKYPLVPSKLKDTYLYFMLLSLKKIKEKGIMGFIVPNTWLLINNTSEFRKHLLSYNISQIVDHGDAIFDDAIVESSTIIMQNEIKENGNILAIKQRGNKELVNHYIDKSIWLNDELNRIVIELSVANYNFIKKIEKISKSFEDSSEIIFGIKPYQVGHGTPTQTREMVDKRIYHSDVKINEKWFPLVTGTDVNRYKLDFNNNEFILYGKNLMYSSNAGKIKSDKILLRRTSHDLRAFVDKNSHYPQNSLFIITSNYNLSYLLCLLNSKLFDFIYKTKCPQVGKVFAEVKPSIIKSLPIIDAKINKQLEFANIAETMLSLNKTLQQQQAKVINMLQRDYGLEKLTKKLETWYELPLQSFFAELAKAKIVLTAIQKDEVQEYFETYQKQAVATKNQIIATDKQIDAMVYELYGLSNEEIEIVENS